MTVYWKQRYWGYWIGFLASSKCNVVIVSYKQAAAKALFSALIFSKQARQCRNAMNSLGDILVFTFDLVLSHSN